MPYSDLLAKSVRQRPVSLSAHLCEVADYARALVVAYRPHLRRLLGEALAAGVEQGVVLAALTHDLGKAAEGFQRALREPQARWEFRHEVLSAAVLLATLELDDDTARLALAAVLTHHRDVDDTQLRNDAGLVALPDPLIMEEVTRKFRRKADEMQPHWRWVQTFCADQGLLQSCRVPASPAALPLPADFLDHLEQRSNAASPFDNREAMALILTRGWMMAADHAVSAGVLHVQSALPEPRLPALRPFQRRVGDHDGDACLEAPTGSGKTNAALLWALRNRQGAARIFYLLPYQASIEAMAGTLGGLLGQESVAVLHARALDYAFREYFERTGEYRSAYQQAREARDVNRLVHKPVKVATPFQLLKWLFGVPRFEIGIGEMVGGLFIFDEIHAYDAHVVALIAELVRILKRLGGHCLFMSATFPPFLKALLHDAVGAQVREFTFHQDTEDAWTRSFLRSPRHHMRWHDAPLEALAPQIVQAALNHERVLVVANRVAQAQAIYETLRHEVPGIALLHSRFTHADRTHKEQSIMAALRERRRDQARVLVATQVVEVSLDVSFDVIFTEVAPVDALLQRFGRVNRYGEHPDGVEVHVARQFDAERLRWVYDVLRQQATLDNAPPDGAPLTVETASEWVRQVYRSGWTEKERSRFGGAREAFRTVLRALRPLHHHPEGLAEFRSLFQSVEVLPRELFGAFDEHLRNQHYLLATQLLVSVPLATFHALNHAGRLQRLKDGVLLADARYDPEVGFLPQEAIADVAIL